jgi:glycosyltransferase involved in cell wall biosynthesis
MASLSIYLTAFDCVKHDFPLRESLIASAQVADEVIVQECRSVDGTREIVEEVQTLHDNIILKDMPRPKDTAQMCVLMNKAQQECNCDYNFQVQADEIIHEKDYAALRDFIDRAHANSIQAAYIYRTNFLGNFSTIYEENRIVDKWLRIARKDSLWSYQLNNDAYLANGDLPVADPRITIFHYSKLGDPAKRYKKEIYIQDLYLGGKHDPRLDETKNLLQEEVVDYMYLFAHYLNTPDVQPFFGDHPAVMANWIEGHKPYEQFKSRVLDKQKEIRDQAVLLQQQREQELLDLQALSNP